MPRDCRPTRLKPRRAENQFSVSPPTFKYFFCTFTFVNALPYLSYIYPSHVHCIQSSHRVTRLHPFQESWFSFYSSFRRVADKEPPE